MGLSEEIDKSTKSKEKLPLKYYIWERRKDVRDTLQIRRYIRTKWWRKQIIKTKNWKYKIEWQEESYDGIKQLPYQEHIKVRNWNDWKLLWPDLNTLIDFPSNSSKVIRIDDIDATPYEWIYIITNQWKKTIIDRNWDSLLENNNYYSNIEARQLWNLSTFIAWNTKKNWEKMIKRTWEIKDFIETTIFNTKWQKILGPTNIIHINNKPVIDSIWKDWLLMKTDSWRIIVKNNKIIKKFQDIKLRYIKWKPIITQYKRNWRRLSYNKQTPKKDEKKIGN